jgi:hypothetical protein
MDSYILKSICSAQRAFCILATALAVTLAPSLAGAENEALGTSKEGGMGATAALASLVYSPIKLVFATGGLVSTGLAWMFSGGDSEVASTVLTRSVRGSYVITPAIIRGDEELEFVGRSPQYRQAPARAQVAAAPPDGW